MPRLRSELTGAVMTVSESTAALLGSEWVAADQPTPDDAPNARARPRKTGTNE